MCLAQHLGLRVVPRRREDCSQTVLAALQSPRRCRPGRRRRPAAAGQPRRCPTRSLRPPGQVKHREEILPVAVGLVAGDQDALVGLADRLALEWLVNLDLVTLHRGYPACNLYSPSDQVPEILAS